MGIKDSLGVVLQKARIEKGLSQAHVAEQAGITKSGLSLIESGDRNTSINTLDNICKVIGINLSDAFEEAEDME